MINPSQGATASNVSVLPVSLPSISPKLIKSYLEDANKSAQAIYALTDIGAKILSERASEGCPEWCANDYYLGGILEAIQGLSAWINETLLKPIDQAMDKEMEQ
ncbi:hypothetical protein CCP3SC1_1680003 [Gammaproteobacteria bacterium]